MYLCYQVYLLTLQTFVYTYFSLFQNKTESKRVLVTPGKQAVHNCLIVCSNTNKNSLMSNFTYFFRVLTHWAQRIVSKKACWWISIIYLTIKVSQCLGYRAGSGKTMLDGHSGCYSWMRTQCANTVWEAHQPRGVWGH